MRPGQNNRRPRGRNNNNNNGGGNNGGNNRRNGNPLTRSYDSSGPDVKVRGTAQTIADRYATLARDALSSGDRIVAENYLQHAEHYNRIIAAAMLQNAELQRERDQNNNDSDDDAGDSNSNQNGSSAQSDNNSDGESQNNDSRENGRSNRGRQNNRGRDRNNQNNNGEAGESEIAQNVSSDASAAPQPNIGETPREFSAENEVPVAKPRRPRAPRKPRVTENSEAAVTKAVELATVHDADSLSPAAIVAKVDAAE